MNLGRHAQLLISGLAETVGIWQWCGALIPRREPWRKTLTMPLTALTVTTCATLAQAQAPTATAPISRAFPRFDLTWQVPLGCPSHAAIAREIDELIAESSGTPRTAPVYANATVTQESDGFALTLTLRDIEAQRRRQIGAPTCEELGHAAALIVAIAVDPTILERRVDPPASGSDAQACSNAPKLYYCRLKDLPAVSMSATGAADRAVAAPAQTNTDALATHAPFWRVGIGTFVSTGILPGIFPGLELFGAAQTEWLRLGLSVSTVNARVEDEAAGRGANFALYRASPRGCLLHSTSHFAIGPCAGVDLGAIWARGYGVASPRSTSGFWAAANLGALFEYRLNRGALLALTGELGVPWWRDAFQLLERPLHKPAQVFGSLGISLAAGWR